MKIDKQNGNVAFNDKMHIYWNVNDDKKKYISVTTLIERYAQHFDKEFWSAYKAFEKLIPTSEWKTIKSHLQQTKKINKEELCSLYDITEDEFNKQQQNILDEWDKANRESCERGTKIHAELENSFYEAGKNVELKKFNIGGKFECRKNYTELDLPYGVYPEYLISRSTPDGVLNIAGQIDCLVKNGNEIIIIDHKGLPLDTPILTSKGWSTMGDLKVGDKVFDKDGNLCNVIVKSEIHHNPCYKIKFSKDFSITSDKDHRWLVYFKTQKNGKYKGKDLEKVMTTYEMYNYFKSLTEVQKKNGFSSIRIKIAKPLNIEEKELPLDPYILGLWLGDGDSSSSRITQEIESKSWEIIKQKGFEIGPNNEHRSKAETRNVYGLMTILRKIGVLKNKHIPDLYFMSSYNQRLDLLRGLMDADGFYDKRNKTFIMRTHYEWQAKGVLALVNSLGVKATYNELFISNGFKPSKCYDIKFTTNEFNPFLCRNTDVIGKENLKNYYSIQNIEEVDMVPTQCIAVDSPSHTYLCTEHLLITHNTNKEIKKKGFYNNEYKSETKMKYPLNKIPDCNFYHYTLQLSTYAWMLQKINPDFIIKDLILNHYDHEGNNTLYHCEYLKHEVELMLTHYKRQLEHEQRLSKYKRIEY